MVQVKDLTELTVRDLWREGKDGEEWWGDLKQETLQVVKRLLEASMKEELLEQLRAGRYRRRELRQGYRKGYRQREILTEGGLVEPLLGVGVSAPSVSRITRSLDTEVRRFPERPLDTVYPYVPRQHCWAHKLRNVAAKLPRKHQKTCLQSLGGQAPRGIWT